MKNKWITGVFCTALLLSACGAAGDEETQVPKTIVVNDAGMEDVTVTDGGTEAPVQPDGGAEEPPVANEQAQSDVGAEAPSASNEQAQPDVGAEEPPVANESVQTYRDIYQQAVGDSVGEAKVFSLIYLDNDDIPELVVLDREFDSYSIYTVKDGTLFCMLDRMTTVEMNYFERSGTFYSFARWNGGGDEGGYGRSYFQVSAEKTITEETGAVLNDAYNALYDEDGSFTGQGVTDYYYMGELTDETTYRELLGSLGVTEDGGRPCAENAVGKEEMLAQLSQ
ncbi:MAG: hypothetical protein K2I07_03380 [Lachnospiraceae bacterium]|nr:hypothetical protein [Lachnospiraceae bacterium]